MSDPAVVGTIVACPKCGSMVQVERPNQAGPKVEIGSANVDSQEITQEAIDAPEPGELEAGGRFTSPETTQQSISDAPTESPPSPEWQSERTQRSRQIGLVVALASCGLLVALMLFGLFVRSVTSKTAEVAIAEEAGNTEEAGNNDDLEAPVVANPDDSGSADSDSTASTKPEDPDKEQPAPATDDPVAVPDQRPSETPSESPKTIDSPVIPPDLMPQTPLMTPIEASPDSSEDRSSGEPTIDNGMGLSELPPGLAEFTNLIDMANDGGIRKPTLEAPPSLETFEIEGPAEELIDPMMIASPPVEINMKRGLSLPLTIATTRKEGYPLADLVMLVSQVAGIPIQLDWISFDLANIDVRRPIEIKKGWKDAAKLLDDIGNTLGADIEQTESLITISPNDKTFADPMNKVFDLSDFGGEAASAADVVNRFLGTKSEESKAVISGPTRPDQQLAIIAVETLRQMRRVTTTISEHRLSRWTQPIQARPESWNVLTGGKSSPQYDAPASVAEVLRRVARINNASCIVNWYDARRRRLSPEQLTLPFAGTDGGTEMSEMLKPFGMQIRKVDANHWWVGTEATYDRLPLIVWTEPLAGERDAFTRQIRKIMAGADEDSFRLAFDPVSDRALLLLPRFVVRQLPAIQAKTVANR